MVGVANKRFTARLQISHGSSSQPDDTNDYRRTSLYITDKDSSQRVLEVVLNAVQLGQLIRGEETVVEGFLGKTEQVGRKLVTGTVRAKRPMFDHDLDGAAAAIRAELSRATGFTDLEIRASDLTNMHRRQKGGEAWQLVAVWVWVEPGAEKEAAERLAQVSASHTFGGSP